MHSTLSNPLRLGLRQERVISPQCLVIFGASGDLTHRKLIPEKMKVKLSEQILGNEKEWEQFSNYLFYESVDLQQINHVIRLSKRLNDIDKSQATHGNRTFYLSVSPNFYASGCKALKVAGLIDDPKKSRIVIEKPFGKDYLSARKLNKIVQSCADESQIYIYFKCSNNFI